MKKIIAIFSMLLISLSLTGCVIDFGEFMPTNTTKETKPVTEGINKSSIEAEIYSNVFEKAKQDLYDEIYAAIIEDIKDGKVDAEPIQDQIYGVVNTAANGNVGVTNYKKNAKNELIAYSTGSAVIFDKKDVSSSTEYKYEYSVITNQHVVEDGDAFKVVFKDESGVDARLIGADKTTDIALIKFYSNNDYYVVTLGDSDELKVGQFVLAIGNPKGETLFGSVSFGIIGGKDRHLLDSNGAQNTILSFIQHDAAINSGNSGGGLYNLDGECIGINSVKYVSSDIEGLNFAIPINLVKEVISEIEEYGSYNGTVSLGITVSPISALTSEGRTQYQVPDSVVDGVLVISVTENGSAYGVLEENDIIIKIQGNKITTSSEISLYIKNARVGTTLSITVLRGGVEQTVTVTFKR